MNDKKRGGFIPLIAAIIIGVLALAGGTVATISVIKNKERQTQPPIAEQIDQPKQEQKSPEPAQQKETGIAPTAPVVNNTPKQEVVINNARGIEPAYQALIHPDRPTQEEMEKKQQQIQAELESMNAALRQAAEDNQKHSQEIQAEVQKEKYAENPTYPIILSFEDSKGNIYKRSEYNDYSGPYLVWPNESSRILRIGDTIRATATAKDPQGRSLEYNWNSNSQAFNTVKGIENGQYKYRSSNALEYTITDADLKSAGETFRLVWQVRVAGTGYYRFGSGQYDDSGFIDYKIIP